MRVIAGSLKGRQLRTPAWEGLRPTSDKLRETLFNILAPRVVGARVIDAFAGTGALGLEALSRGAAWVTFIERDPRAQRLIAENLERCGTGNLCAIMRASAARGFERLRADAAFVPFDIILLDPPYDQPSEKILKDAARMVAPRGVVVLEHARRRPAPQSVGGLVSVRHVETGDSALSFYEPVD
jgi:16S rRNA (guanine(966)-N(2))-methyltransferase RsmD